MSLIHCKECGREISSEAKACPHCGAPIKKEGLGCLSLIGIVVGLGFVALVIVGLALPDHPSPAAHQNNTVKTSIHASQFELEFTNDGTADWTEAVIYINGAPPFTYKQTTPAPPVGESRTVRLADFVKNGDRFNPISQAVTEVWIGGSGHDFECYNFKR